jgi:acyl-homoserine lactone acylase PvdQ
LPAVLLLPCCRCCCGCALAPDAAAGAGAADERLARSVTIVRDEWGVPTVYGPTDAAVAFGLAWAQAEDNYWQIEEDYIHADWAGRPTTTASGTSPPTW